MWRADILASGNQLTGIMCATSCQHYLLMYCTNGLALVSNDVVFFIGIESMFSYGISAPATFSVPAAQGEMLIRPGENFTSISVLEHKGHYVMRVLHGPRTNPVLETGVDIAVTSSTGLPRIVSDSIFRIFAYIERSFETNSMRMEMVLMLPPHLTVANDVPITAALYKDGMIAHVSPDSPVSPEGREVKTRISVRIPKVKYQKLLATSRSGLYIFGVVPELGDFNYLPYLRLPGTGHTYILL